MLPLRKESGILSEFLKHYASLKSEFDVTLNDGSSEHAYLISVTPKQIEEISSLRPSLNRSVDAVLIFKEQLGITYLIVYRNNSGALRTIPTRVSEILNSIIFKSIG